MHRHKRKGKPPEPFVSCHIICSILKLFVLLSQLPNHVIPSGVEGRGTITPYPSSRAESRDEGRGTITSYYRHDLSTYFYNASHSYMLTIPVIYQHSLTLTLLF